MEGLKMDWHPGPEWIECDVESEHTGPAVIYCPDESDPEGQERYFILKSEYYSLHG